MGKERKSLSPLEGASRYLRRRLPLSAEFLLALPPTVTILGVLFFVEVLTEQRLLFASLASSAFLIYLDPEHGTNAVPTLVISQVIAALLGFVTFMLAGPGYLAAGLAMVSTIVLMILIDRVHPPAVSTSLSFALRAGDERNLVLFGLAVGITALLVFLQRAAVWVLARYNI